MMENHPDSNRPDHAHAKAGNGRAENGGTGSGMLTVDVTYLEQLAPPPLANHPDNATRSLVCIDRPSVSFFRRLYNAVGERWLWWERRALSDAQLAALIAEPRRLIYVGYSGEQEVGFAETLYSGANELSVAYFGLLPKWIGRGFGKWMLNSVLREAWQQNPLRVTLNTCSLDHPNAMRLYCACGFRPYQYKRITIDDPRENPTLGFNPQTD